MACAELGFCRIRSHAREGHKLKSTVVCVPPHSSINPVCDPLTNLGTENLDQIRLAGASYAKLRSICMLAPAPLRLCTDGDSDSADEFGNTFAELNSICKH